MKVICFITISCFFFLMVGCSSPDASNFYRHSWDYYHKPDYYDGPEMTNDLYMSEEELDHAYSEFRKNVLTPYIDKIKTELPTRSQITLKGGGGCLSYCPYNLFIVDVDGLVLAKLETEEEEDLYFEIPATKYDKFWTEYLTCKDDLNRNSYGKSFSTGDYGFQLIIEFKRLEESYTKTYELTVGSFEDKQFEALYLLIMNMVDEERRWLPVDAEAFYDYIEKERDAAATRATDLFQKTPELKTYELLFEITDADFRNPYYGLYFNKEYGYGTDRWEAVFKPKQRMPANCDARLAFPVKRSDDTVLVGLTPQRVMKCLEEICDIPFVQGIASNNSQATVRFSAAGDRLHTNSKDVEKYRSILSYNGIEPGDLKDWMSFYVYPEGKSGPWTLIHHPANTDIFLVTFGVTEIDAWRKQCQEIAPETITLYNGKWLNIGPPYALLNGQGTVLKMLDRKKKKSFWN